MSDPSLVGNTRCCSVTDRYDSRHGHDLADRTTSQVRYEVLLKLLVAARARRVRHVETNRV